MKKKILFLCTGNSCRSQMAEGWCRHFWSHTYDCYSAGIQKHGMNARAIKVMKEAGVDISKHYSKTTDELLKEEFDFIVTVCDAAKETCPYLSGATIVHMGFEDPPRLTQNMNDEGEIMKIYQRVRDEIKDAIQKLPKHLDDDK